MHHPGGQTHGIQTLGHATLDAGVGPSEIAAWDAACDRAEDEARTEAWRCLSCGNCIECDGCLGSCPEDAVIKLGKGNRYRYDYAKCTGCGTCYEQCPVHAIDMIAER